MGMYYDFIFFISNKIWWMLLVIPFGFQLLLLAPYFFIEKYWAPNITLIKKIPKYFFATFITLYALAYFNPLPIPPGICFQATVRDIPKIKNTKERIEFLEEELPKVNKYYYSAKAQQANNLTELDHNRANIEKELNQSKKDFQQLDNPSSVQYIVVENLFRQNNLMDGEGNYIPNYKLLINIHAYYQRITCTPSLTTLAKKKGLLVVKN